MSPIYSVELELFEGPLDLLLHLVRKHELEILDIPIAFVAEKYLEYLDVMRQLDLEIAGDYLVMAATLAYLKSRELLPPEPRAGETGESGDEDGEDPREALIRRLVEYERFKQAAAELDSLPMSGRDVFARGAELVMPPVDPGLQPVSLFNLAEAYYRVLTRAKVKSSHDVTIEAVTVAQRIKQLALLLDESPSLDFEELFLSQTWNSEAELRTMLVVTLMSILEMVKLGVAGVQQPLDSTTIRIYRRASAEQTQQALADYDEEASFGAATPATSEAQTTAERARPSEAELDAVEEATLLAEALASVQEPSEPVLGYDDEGEDVAANDPAEGDGEDVGEDAEARGRRFGGRRAPARDRASQQTGAEIELELDGDDPVLPDMDAESALTARAGEPELHQSTAALADRSAASEAADGCAPPDQPGPVDAPELAEAGDVEPAAGAQAEYVLSYMRAERPADGSVAELSQEPGELPRELDSEAASPAEAPEADEAGDGERTVAVQEEYVPSDMREDEASVAGGSAAPGELPRELDSETASPAEAPEADEAGDVEHAAGVEEEHVPSDMHAEDQADGSAASLEAPEPAEVEGAVIAQNSHVLLDMYSERQAAGGLVHGRALADEVEAAASLVAAPGPEGEFEPDLVAAEEPVFSDRSSEGDAPGPVADGSASAPEFGGEVEAASPWRALEPAVVGEKEPPVEFPRELDGEACAAASAEALAQAAADGAVRPGVDPAEPGGADSWAALESKPARSDSDVVGGGLFLNTGEGLGERELDVDEDDGDEEDAP